MKRNALLLTGLLSALGTLLQAQAPIIEWQNASVTSAPLIHQFEEDGYKWEEKEYIYEVISDLVAGTDGSYAGVSYNSSWSGNKPKFVKFDAIGNLIVKKNIADLTEWVYAITKASDGGYVLVGSSYVYDSRGAGLYSYINVIKVDESGNMIWKESYKGATEPVVPRDRYNYSSTSHSIITTKDGGYLIGATTATDAGNDKSQNSKGENDYWLIKIDAAGLKQWDKTIGGNNSDGINGGAQVKVVQATDGGYFVAGTSTSPASEDKTEDSYSSNIYEGDYWVVKLDNTGKILWDKTLGGSGVDNLQDIIATTGGGCILGGDSNSPASGNKTADAQETDLWIVKMTAAGAIEWQKNMGGEATDNFRSIFQSADGGFVVGGSYSDLATDIYGGSTQLSKYWIFKLTSAGTEVWQKKLGGSGGENLSKLIPLMNDHFLIAGTSRSGISGDRTVTQTAEQGMDFWLMEMMPCNNSSKADKTICQGDSYNFNGNMISTAGVYTGTFTNIHGCDSIVTFTLGMYSSVKPTVSVKENLLSSTATYASYQWLMNGMPVAGATSESYTAKEPGAYQLIVVNNNNCKDTSQVIQPLFNANLFVPNTFSPNGDSKNDILKAYGNQLLSARLLIFNQWGQKIFETSNATQSGWDGNIAGKPQAVGVYAYVLEATLSDGKKQTLKGSFTLIR